MVATRPIITETSGRRSAGKIRKLVANTVGIIAPPRKPWSARNTTIMGMESANEQARLIRVKPAADRANSTRVDSSRDRKPESGIMITSAIR